MLLFYCSDNDKKLDLSIVCITMFFLLLYLKFNFQKEMINLLFGYFN